MCVGFLGYSLFVLACIVYLHKNIFFCALRVFIYSRDCLSLDTLIWCFDVLVFFFPMLIERMTWVKNKQ